MKVVLICFALVVVSLTFVTAARAQSLDDNEHDQAFKSWAIDTQQPDPVPNMLRRPLMSAERRDPGRRCLACGTCAK